MANGKKSFVLYADLLETVRKLPDDKAGELFKLILRYVNDENPDPEDLLVEIAFEPIKQQLKRDLRKYEEKKKQWSEAGKRSAEARAKRKEEEAQKSKKRSTDSTNVKNRSTELTVNDNDTVTVNVNDNDTVTNIDSRKRSFQLLTHQAFTELKEEKGINQLIINEEAVKFFEYWTEKGIKAKKMRFEKEKTFEVKKRASRWLDNCKRWTPQSNDDKSLPSALDFAKQFD